MFHKHSLKYDTAYLLLIYIQYVYLSSRFIKVPNIERGTFGIATTLPIKKLFTPVIDVSNSFSFAMTIDNFYCALQVDHSRTLFPRSTVANHTEHLSPWRWRGEIGTHQVEMSRSTISLTLAWQPIPSSSSKQSIKQPRFRWTTEANGISFPLGEKGLQLINFYAMDFNLCLTRNEAAYSWSAQIRIKLRNYTD